MYLTDLPELPDADKLKLDFPGYTMATHSGGKPWRYWTPGYDDYARNLNRMSRSEREHLFFSAASFGLNATSRVCLLIKAGEILAYHWSHNDNTGATRLACVPCGIMGQCFGFAWKTVRL